MHTNPVLYIYFVSYVGISLITMGEDIGSEMSLRMFEHVLHYGELPVRRVVPLALSLLYISNPDYSIIDQLSRLSHDQDALLSQAAILGLGFVSAGRNIYNNNDNNNNDI